MFRQRQSVSDLLTRPRQTGPTCSSGPQIATDLSRVESSRVVLKQTKLNSFITLQPGFAQPSAPLIRGCRDKFCTLAGPFMLLIGLAFDAAPRLGLVSLGAPIGCREQPNKLLLMATLCMSGSPTLRLRSRSFCLWLAGPHDASTTSLFRRIRLDWADLERARGRLSGPGPEPESLLVVVVVVAAWVGLSA